MFDCERMRRFQWTWHHAISHLALPGSRSLVQVGLGKIELQRGLILFLVWLCGFSDELSSGDGCGHWDLVAG